MKYIRTIFYILLSYPLASMAESIKWRDECVGYYKLQLPDKLEIGLYPTDRIITENFDIDVIFGKFYKTRSQGKNIKGNYSRFYYNNYRIMVSEKKDIDINKYKEKVGSLLSGNFHTYNIKDYSSNVFFLSYDNSHSLYINERNRLYQFMKAGKDDLEINSARSLNLDKESDIYLLLNHFYTREFYEIPSTQGFCFPYGFIKNITGEPERNISVTYRMEDHPDVMIVFQDASLQFRVPLNDDLTPVKDYNAKDYAKWLWNNIYMLYPNQKRELLWPRWFTVTMDGRKGSGSFLQVTKKNGEKDYGYLAFVRGNPENPTKEPDLQVFVSSISDIAEGHPRMTPDELKALAEHIVNSVRYR